MRETLLRLVRYFISGVTGALVHIGVLTLLVEFGHMRAFIASAGGFLVAFGVSFILQKYWTFKNTEQGAAGRQMVIYFVIQVTNLLLNIGAMFMLTEVWSVQYQIAQILTIGAIACEAYFLYKRFVFIVAPTV